MRLVIASGNRHKVVELAAMIRRAMGAAVGEATVIGLSECGERYGPVPDIEETAPDFAGNASLKAEGIAAWLRAAGEPGDTWVLADDSGVCVDAFDGAPGVLSARFCGYHGSDAANNDKLVAELRALDLTDSRARYVCVLALCRVDGAPMDTGGQGTKHFHGRWEVLARTEARGSGGFGYDPHCWLLGPDGQPEDRTVAELPADEKARLSHRGAAFAELFAWWRTL